MKKIKNNPLKEFLETHSEVSPVNSFDSSHLPTWEEGFIVIEPHVSRWKLLQDSPLAVYGYIYEGNIVSGVARSCDAQFHVSPVGHRLSLEEIRKKNKEEFGWDMEEIDKQIEDLLHIPTCKQCAFYSNGDPSYLHCAVNPGGEAGSCSSYEYITATDVTAGNYPRGTVTVDAKGRVTAGLPLTNADMPNHSS